MNPPSKLRLRLQPLTRCMPCSSRTARSVQTLGFCVFQRRTLGHLQPWAEVWCGLFMIRARRIVLRARICTVLHIVRLPCAAFTFFATAVARGGVLHIRLNANSLPGLYSDVDRSTPCIFIIRKTLQKVKSKAHKISLLCAFFFKVQLQSAISCTYPRNNVLRRTENARKKCAKMHGKRTISII